MDALVEILKSHIQSNSFENLKIPLYVGVSNLDKGTFEIFDSGELFKIVTASASYPVIFDRVDFHGFFYVDCVLFNNMPVEPLLKKDAYVVGVHVNNYKPPEEVNLVTVAERVFTLVIKKNVEPSFKLCDEVIDPFLEKDYGILDFKQTEELFSIGYQAGIEFVERFTSQE
jgi:NTE family protein